MRDAVDDLSRFDQDVIVECRPEGETHFRRDPPVEKCLFKPRHEAIDGITAWRKWHAIEIIVIEKEAIPRHGTRIIADRLAAKNRFGRVRRYELRDGRVGNVGEVDIAGSCPKVTTNHVGRGR